VEDPRLADARRAWPDLRADPGAYLAHLDATGAAAEHRADVWLALACAAGDARALTVLDERYLGPLSRTLSRLDPSPAFADEVRQQMRRQLLVAEGGAPRIAGYSGRAPLASWLQVVMLRAALALLKSSRRAEPDESALLEVQGPGLDPELDYLKHRCRRELKEAVQAALGALPPRERGLLKLHHLDGLTMDEIGALHGVHASTACRWIDRARERLSRLTRQAVEERLRLSPSEMESLVDLVRSELDLSLSRVLATAES
jgi:RNA polymerase sigma-70 factor, ECF subfamily